MTSETDAGDDDATASDVSTGTETQSAEVHRADLTKPSRVFPIVLALALGLAGGYQLGLLAEPGWPRRRDRGPYPWRGRCGCRC